VRALAARPDATVEFGLEWISSCAPIFARSRPRVARTRGV